MSVHVERTLQGSCTYVCTYLVLQQHTVDEERSDVLLLPQELQDRSS